MKHRLSGQTSALLDDESEFDRPDTVAEIAHALQESGYTVHLVEATESLPRWFLTHSVDLVFNIAEGMQGATRESQVPAVLESLGVPNTGSNSTALALALDKARTKQMLHSEGIPTPLWQVFHQADEALDPRLSFPLIVKPNREGSGKGIWRENVVYDAVALRRQVLRVIDRYRQEALVEEYIDGMELTVGVLGKTALPVLEIDFSTCRESGEFFYSWRMKEFQGDDAQHLSPEIHCPARLSPLTTRQAQELALRTHYAVGCDDFSRTDIRLRLDGALFVLEINPLPGLSPVDSNFPRMGRAAGLSYEALIQQIVRLAIERQHDGRRLPGAPINRLAVSRAFHAEEPLEGGRTGEH